VPTAVKSDKGAATAKPMMRVNGTMVTSPLDLILGRHENGRPCRVGCSMLPYVTAPTPQGAGVFSAFLELERDDNYAQLLERI
jgi:hypothetical protein